MAKFISEYELTVEKDYLLLKFSLEVNGNPVPDIGYVDHVWRVENIKIKRNITDDDYFIIADQHDNSLMLLNRHLCTTVSGSDIYEFIDNLIELITVAGIKNVNLSQVLGTTAAVNIGDADDGTLRTTIATDDLMAIEINNMGTTMIADNLVLNSIDESLDAIGVETIKSGVTLSSINNNILATQPLSIDEIKVRGGTNNSNSLDYEIKHLVLEGESYPSTVVTSTVRTLGLVTGTGTNFISYMDTPAAILITSSEEADSLLGEGAQKVKIDGLNGNWEEISEIVDMNGRSGTTTTSSDWFRINKMTVIQAGTYYSNHGTIFATSTGATLTNGVPSNIVYSNIANYKRYSTTMSYSIPAGYNFEFVDVNFFTTFTDGNAGQFTEYIRDETSSLLTSEKILYNLTSRFHDFKGRKGITGRSTIEGRIRSTSGSKNATVIYSFYIWKAKT